MINPDSPLERSTLFDKVASHDLVTVSFYKAKLNSDYKIIDRSEKEFLFSITSTRSKVRNHPRMEKRSRIQVEITTCKRMITLIKKAIKKFELAQKSLLIPDYENPKYLKTLAKLEYYKNRLNTAMSSSSIDERQSP